MADPTQRVDYSEVARLTREAHSRGISTRQYVASQFGWTPKHAAQMIYRARKAGENIPSLPRNPKKKVGREGSLDDMLKPMLACNDCGECFEITDQQSLVRHTVTEHKRFPTKVERTPVLA